MLGVDKVSPLAYTAVCKTVGSRTNYWRSVVSNTAHKIRDMVTQRVAEWPRDGTSQGQVVTDCAVYILSNMRPVEIDNALFMSLGHDGVAELIASRACGIGDSTHE
ncbi:MAG: hypothetical protein Unbinned3138contig1001_4 [Prokaryotic dsDNA virus sp.]|nr:MAG: hypothetical protein Unbinned3138contig1001_4 [Prokaryotic dsDNA virus sp.]